MIPYHISFLKPPWSFSHPCQHQGPYISLISSMSFSSVHISPISTLSEITCNNSLAPPRHLQNECLTNLLIFSAVWCVNGHHQSSSKEHCCTSLTCMPRQLQIRNIRGSLLLDGEDDRQACARVNFFRPAMRLIGQLDFTIVSKRASLKSVR